MKLRNDSEAERKKHILVRMSELGGFVWNAPTGLFINPRSVCADCARRCPRIRVGIPGQPDTMGLFPLPGEEHAFFAGVEVKKPGGRQRGEQKKWEHRCNSVGGEYIIARDADEVEQKLREAGAIA